MDTRPIAIIDSGLGGLPIFKAIKSTLPRESILYLADHAFFPYSQKSTTTINRRLTTLLNFILQKNCKAVVIACNTITASSIKFLRSLYSMPFIGTEPAIKLALKHVKQENIVVLATPKTISSSSFKNLVKKLDHHNQVTAIACKDLASSIENSFSSKVKLKKTLTSYLKKLPSNTSAVVLGCTHYILIKDLIKSLLKQNTIVVEPSQAIANQLKKVLKNENLLSNQKNSKAKFLTTGNLKKVNHTTSLLVKERIIFTSCNL